VTTRLRELAIGVSAAMRAPLWLTGSRFQRLVRGVAGSSQIPPGIESATRASVRTLRVLARIPLLPWRNTCLYRSVAECLVLRSNGIGCRLQLGVSRDVPTGHGIAAHAWVERPDTTNPDDSHVLLRPSS